MQKILYTIMVLLILTGNITCTKSETALPGTVLQQEDAAMASQVPAVTPVTYLIPKGAQYCQPNPLVFTTKSKLSFAARFDSSCIYTTVDPANQDDINKLYGFSDCGTHHLDNSARIGWRWSNNALRIFAFVHNDGNMLFTEVTTAKIGTVIKCSIVCRDTSYVFTVNDNGFIAEALQR